MHGNDASSADVWKALVEFGVVLLPVGRHRTHERFVPQDPDASADAAKGVWHFIVSADGTAPCVHPQNVWTPSSGAYPR